MQGAEFSAPVAPTVRLCGPRSLVSVAWSKAELQLPDTCRWGHSQQWGYLGEALLSLLTNKRQVSATLAVSHPSHSGDLFCQAGFHGSLQCSLPSRFKF